MFRVSFPRICAALPQAPASTPLATLRGSLKQVETTLQAPITGYARKALAARRAQLVAAIDATLIAQRKARAREAYRASAPQRRAYARNRYLTCRMDILEQRAERRFGVADRRFLRKKRYQDKVAQQAKKPKKACA
jgi:hypothetical protein